MKYPFSPFALILLFTLFAICLNAQHSSFDPRYHTVSEVIEEITALADTYSAFCELDSLGHSGVDSITIWGLKISSHPLLDEDKTCVAIIGGQHADEPAGVEVCMWLARELLQMLHRGDATALRWAENLEIWIIPQMNPDGRRMCLDSGYVDWRKTKRDNNLNGIFDAYEDGVDPNRNWDYLWDIYEPEDLDNDKGPYPFSEQCVITIRDFFIRERPLWAIDLHSPDYTGGNKMWFSWWFSEGPYYGYSPDMINCWLDIRNDYADTTYDETGTRYARASSFHDKPKLQTWAYYNLGICSIVLEITNQRFWEGEIIDTISARVGRGIFYLLDRSMEKLLVTSVVDSATEEPILNASVEILELSHAYFPPRTVDPIHGTNRRWLRDGYYTVNVSVRGFLPKQIDSVYVSPVEPTHLLVQLNRDTGINEISTPQSLSIQAFPNPFNAAVSLAGVGDPKVAGRLGWKIFDLCGKLVAEPTQPSAFAEGTTPAVWTPVERMPSGVYLAAVVSDREGIIATKRILYLK